VEETIATQHRDIATGTIVDVPCLAEGALSRLGLTVRLEALL